MDNIIRTLKNQIITSIRLKEDGDKANWMDGKGILITRDEAIEILKQIDPQTKQKYQNQSTNGNTTDWPW